MPSQFLATVAAQQSSLCGLETTQLLGGAILVALIFMEWTGMELMETSLTIFMFSATPIELNPKYY